MVTNVMSLTGNGFKDWWLQRATAILMAAYTIFLFVFIVTHPNIQFDQWQKLFTCNAFKITTMITLLAFLMHTWIGIWTVTTDYLKCTVLRTVIQWSVILFLLVQFIYCIMIIWGQ